MTCEWSRELDNTSGFETARFFFSLCFEYPNLQFGSRRLLNISTLYASEAPARLLAWLTSRPLPLHYGAPRGNQRHFLDIFERLGGQKSPHGEGYWL